MTTTRRLAAILAADVAGYSRLMGADEEGTLERLKALRRASSSIRKSPSTTAASSRPRVTACYKSGGNMNLRGGDAVMNRFGLIAGLAIAVLLLAAANADDQHVIAQPDSLKWTAAPPVLPKGAQIAALYGDPDKAEPFVFRLKFPAGYKVAAHMHPNDYDVTVLSGTMYLGMGDKFDPARGEGLKAGGYLHLPKGMHHYEWSDEDTVIQLSGVGPVGMTYLNPADDPRKTQ